MFWKPLRDFTTTLSFRLDVGHAGIFLASAAIDRKDRDVLEAQLREYVRRRAV